MPFIFWDQDANKNKLFRLKIILIGFALVVNLLIIFLGFQMFRGNHRSNLLTSENSLKSNLSILSENVKNAITNIDGILLTVIDRINITGCMDDCLHSFLAEQKVLHPFIRTLFVLGADGIVKVGSRTPMKAVGYQVKDRVYFNTHLKYNSPKLYIGPPIRARIGNDISMAVSRGIYDLKGHLFGVVVISINSRYFEGLFSSIFLENNQVGDDVSPKGSIIHNDHTVLSQYPFDDNIVGTKPDFIRSLKISETVSSRGTHYSHKLPIKNGSIIVWQKLGAVPLTIILESWPSALVNTFQIAALYFCISVLCLAILSLFVIKIVIKQADRISKQSISLVESEEKFRLFFENNLDYCYIISTNGSVLDVNQTALNALGYKKQMLVGKQMNTFCASESQLKIDPIFNQKEKSIKFDEEEISIIKKDGTKRVVMMGLELIKCENNKPKYFLVMLKDVTDRKKVEEKLLKQQELLQSIFYNIPVMVVIHDPNSKQITVNKYCEDTLGWTNEEIKKINLLEKCYPNIKYRQKVKDYMSAATVEWHEFKEKEKNGNIINTAWSNFKLSDKTHIGIGLDITERKQAEKFTKEQAKLLDLVFEHSPDSIVLLDKDYNFIRVSQAYAKSTQKDISDFPGNNHFEMYPSVLKNEFDRVKSEKCIYRKLARPFTFPDNPEWGTTYWDLELVPLLNEKGDIDYFLFTLKDVTNRKKAENELLEAHANLEQKILDRTIELQQEVKIRQLIEKDLLSNMDELKRFNDLAVDRELQMINLKKEINKLLKQINLQEKYKIH